MAKTYDDLRDALRSPERVRVLYLMVPGKAELGVDLRVFPELESLTLLGKDLRRLPEGLFACRKLRKLHLSMPLAALPRDIGRLEDLEELWVTSAGLERVPDALRSLKKLRYLNLEYNQLRSLPDVFDELPRLETLGLFENRRLTRLPPSLLEAGALKWVQVACSPLPRTPQLEELSARVPAFFCRFPELSHERRPRPPPASRRASVPALLARLRESNARDGVAQRVYPADPVPARIPTLAAGKTWPVSPMLRARFEFAGRWVAAFLEQTWLAAGELAPLAPALRRQVALRREHWTQSPVSKLPEDRLTLFGADRRAGDETYLVWTPGKAEPAVSYFAGASEKRHRDLRAFLEAIAE